MRNLILGVVGAAAFALATPAIAQVHVQTGTPGVGIHVDSGNHGQRRSHRGYRANARGDCRQVTTRTVRPNGTVVVKKRTRC